MYYSKLDDLHLCLCFNCSYRWLYCFKFELTRLQLGFNFGRILTVAAVFGSGALISHFGKDYAQIGTITSFIFAVGMVAILLAPDTASRQLQD